VKSNGGVQGLYTKHWGVDYTEDWWPRSPMYPGETKEEYEV